MCSIVRRVLSDWKGGRIAATACKYTPSNVRAGVDDCLAKSSTIVEFRTCGDVRNAYERKLAEDNGGLPSDYTLMPCSAATGLLEKAKAKQAEILAQQRAEAERLKQEKAKMTAARNRALNEAAQKGLARVQKTFGAGDKPLISSVSELNAVKHTGDLDFRNYDEGDALKALYYADFSVLKENRFGVIVYISAIQNTFANELTQVDSPCALLADTDMDAGLENAVMKASGLGTFGSPASQSQATDAGIQNILGALSLYAKEPQVMFELAARQGVLKSRGRRDAIRLTKNYGCANPITKRIYDNAKLFVLQRAPN